VNDLVDWSAYLTVTDRALLVATSNGDSDAPSPTLANREADALTDTL